MSEGADIDVHQLRMFLAVAEELHFGRAAERLHIAQPPLSRAVKQLEREVGATLFRRTTRSVALTSAGQALVLPAREVLASLARAEDAVEAAVTGRAGVVRVDFAGVSTHAVVARLARAVRAEAPGIRLELSSQKFARPAMRRLLDGDSDLVLGRWDVVPPDVCADVVVRDDLVVAVPDTHALAGRARASMAELAGQGFVSLPPHEGAVLLDRLRQLTRAHGFVADVVQEAPDTQTALALVGAEVGCHLTFTSVAVNASHPHVAFVALDGVSDDAEGTVQDVHLRAARRRGDDNPALRVVVDQLLQLPPSAGGPPHGSTVPSASETAVG
ncbi:DNA-binding transcriptional LysR family regulator [Nocardioides zeae]|uniref:DNA-binding transcriptional LysR family regulator n=1 Tax=Nocardioides zeae TaxID=1457234 RepID=A0ACC6IEA9_9ACTN|nr:LysR family transcriptional regulator [Nocardioides zeae]MDR6174197.1 DNA-binding transcriptional LysR family regulator [Nocardioides zeae]MDR6209004.1 DNA-binding transcriptional LysR family regulator [Nocardioides zeae]